MILNWLFVCCGKIHVWSGPSTPRFRKSKEETTWPRPGQNMWMSVDSQEELDKLMKSLNQTGIRESKLHRALEKNYDSILRYLTI